MGENDQSSPVNTPNDQGSCKDILGRLISGKEPVHPDVFPSPSFPERLVLRYQYF
jgi:hypothetical protein